MSHRRCHVLLMARSFADDCDRPSSGFARASTAVRTRTAVDARSDRFAARPFALNAFRGNCWSSAGICHRCGMSRMASRTLMQLPASCAVRTLGPVSHMFGPHQDFRAFGDLCRRKPRECVIPPPMYQPFRHSRELATSATHVLTSATAPSGERVTPADAATRHAAAVGLRRHEGGC